ncbi:MAG: carboxypeptidase regulatory-like domain-containing protein, partial [Vicinamibacterales bacterium]
MLRALPCLLAILAFVGARPAPAQTTPSQPARDTSATVGLGTSVIRGRILDAASGRGLPRAEVRAGPNAPQFPNRIVMTDADGHYEIKGLPAETYVINVSKPNYVRASWGAERVEGPGRRIPLAEGQVLEKIDVRLARAGVVTGKVVDEFGDPVTDVFVTAMHYQYIQGSRRLIQAGRGGSTNDIGEYRVYGLSPGQYFVSATLRNFNGMNADTSDRSAYAPTFYPGTGNVGQAQRLTIAPGQIAPGINLTLLPIQTARVSGSALDADGQPMANMMINVMQRVGSAMVGNSGAQIRPNGTFTVKLTPGDYLLRVFGPGTTDSAAMELAVTGGDIDDLQLVATRPTAIRGRIVFTESATSAPPPRPTLFDMGAVREWMIGQQVRSQAKIKDDGTFEISLQPGHVLIRGAMTGTPAAPGPNGPSPWRIRRVLVNDLDVADTGLDVTAGAAIENVVVEMTNRVSNASGRVTDAEGKTVRDCYVIVFAQDPVHWTVQTRHLSVSRPAQDDRFHARLLPGDYYGVAMSDVEVNAWTDPEFLALAREHATKFSIADGETKT